MHPVRTPPPRQHGPGRGALVALPLILLALACHRPESSAKAASAEDESKKEQAVPVEVMALTTGPIEEVLRFSTNLDAERQVQVHAQAARLVRDRLVEEGTSVLKGQLLLRLQDDEQQSILAKAQSQLDRAKREKDRVDHLHQRQLVSDQAYTDAVFDFEQKRIALEDARREVSYADVTAPIAGMITRRLVNVGDQVTIGQHLFDLVDFSSLVAPIYVPEAELARLVPGKAARLSSQATGDRTYTGRIERIAPVVDPKSGTVKVVVGLTDWDGLRPGMYVDVTLVTAHRDNALLVPKRALVYDKDQAFVYRLKPGPERRVERVPVIAAVADKEFIEPREGLAVGDQIVVLGMAGLKDDALVRLPSDPKPESDGSSKPAA